MFVAIFFEGNAEGVKLKVETSTFETLNWVIESLGFRLSTHVSGYIMSYPEWYVKGRWEEVQ